MRDDPYVNLREKTYPQLGGCKMHSESVTIYFEFQVQVLLCTRNVVHQEP